MISTTNGAKFRYGLKRVSTWFPRRFAYQSLAKKTSRYDLGYSMNSDKRSENLLKVAIIGRPNVGKSTLFNRLTGTRQAIVTSIPGTTRDRKEGKAHIAGLPFHLMDTGGLDDRGIICIDIQKQIKHALVTCDVVLFVVDARSGLTPIGKYNITISNH